MQHADKHTYENDASDERLEVVTDVTTTSCAVTAEDKERQEHHDDYEDGQPQNVVDEAQMIQVKLEDGQCLFAGHDVSITVEFPRDGRSHPKRLSVGRA